MFPTVTQHLQSLRVRLNETIVPELPADARFAREQALLISATLDFLIDNHEHEYRYQVIENLEYRQLLSLLSSEDVEGMTDARALLDEPGPEPQDAQLHLSELAEQNRRLKEITQVVYAAVTADPASDRAVQARQLLADIGQRQVKRELSWYRLTGFPQGAGHISDALTVG
jgi:hypothetical protein